MFVYGPFESLTPVDPAELLGLVPLLFGHQPQEALVVLAFSEQGQPRGVIKQTLPSPHTADTVVLAQLTVQVLSRMPAIRQVVLIGYGTDEQVAPTMDVVQFLLSNTGIGISEALRFDDSRYWSYLCQEPGCCRADGEPVDPASSDTAAYASLLGLTPPADSTTLARNLPATPPPHQWPADAMFSICRVLDTTAAGRILADERAAWPGGPASSKLVRDAVTTLLSEWKVVTDRPQFLVLGRAPRTKSGVLRRAALGRGSSRRCSSGIGRCSYDLSTSPGAFGCRRRTSHE